MSAEEEKKLDQFTRKILLDTGLEKPSPGFLKHVMGKIEKGSQFVYKPLISKLGWGVIAVFLTVALAWGLKLKPNEAVSELFGTLKVPRFSSINFFDNLQIPGAVTLILVSASVMLLLQVYLIKNRHAKKWDHQN